MRLIPKTKSYLMVSGSKERDHWHGMGSLIYLLNSNMCFVSHYCNQLTTNGLVVHLRNIKVIASFY